MSLKSQISESITLVVAVVVSIALVFVAFLILIQPSPLPELCAQPIGWDKILCMEPNEIGDMLAGVFAPITFLWVALAVFLQRSELRSQREELEQNRVIAIGQAETMREQTTHLAAQRIADEMRVADNQIDDLIPIVQRELDSLMSDHYEYRLDNEDWSTMPLEAERVAADVPSFERLQRTLETSLGDAIRVAQTVFTGGQVRVPREAVIASENLLEHIWTIREIAQRASPAKRASVRRLQLDMNGTVYFSLSGAIREQFLRLRKLEHGTDHIDPQMFGFRTETPKGG